MARLSKEEMDFDIVSKAMLYNCKDIAGIKRKVTRMKQQIDEVKRFMIHRKLNSMSPDDILSHQKRHPEDFF